MREEYAEGGPDVVLSRALIDGRKVLSFGNGGSASDAEHLAAELVGRFEGERRSLPAIALTAYASAEDRERALAAGYDGHIAKPVDAEELCTALTRLTPKTRV